MRDSMESFADAARQNLAPIDSAVEALRRSAKDLEEHSRSVQSAPLWNRWHGVAKDQARALAETHAKRNEQLAAQKRGLADALLVYATKAAQLQNRAGLLVHEASAHGFVVGPDGSVESRAGAPRGLYAKNIQKSLADKALRVVDEHTQLQHDLASDIAAIRPGVAGGSAPATRPQAPDSTAGLHPYQGVTPEAWLADVQNSLSTAQQDLRDRVANKKPGEKLAIVFDIDNTSLATSFADNPLAAPAVQPSLELAKLAQQLGVRVFFVTDRPDFFGFDQNFTRAELTNAGYTVSADDIRDRDFLTTLGTSAQDLKTQHREQIEHEGYSIVQSIGNNWSDLNGGHAERVYKLPDENQTLP